MQPEISCGLCTSSSFTPISEEGMGEDSFPNVRSPNRHMLGGRAHLPDIERVSVDARQCMLLLLLYHFLQFIHRLTHPNLNREGHVRLNENPTPELKLVI
jgi:hypothetical protein